MKIILMVNKKCNIACEHCFLPYTGERSPEETLELTKGFVNEGNEVTIAGSETLLNPKYLESYAAANQKYLLTNGIILSKNPSLYNRIKDAGIDRLKFSIHFGIQKELNSVPESLVARVMKEAQDRGFTTDVATTIDSRNYDSIDEMCERAKSYGAKELKLLSYMPMGNADGTENLTLSEKAKAIVFSNVEQERLKYDSDALYIRLSGNFGPRAGSKGEHMAAEGEYCPAGKLQVAIDPHNNIYGCPFTMQPYKRIGTLEDGKIVLSNDIFEGKRGNCIAYSLAIKNALR